MKWPRLTRPRVLIVENEELDLQGNKNDLDSISTNRLKKLGIADFDFSLARATDEAEQKLAKKNGRPYDLMLLDLGLPITKTQPLTDTPDNGEKVLNLAKRTGAVKEVVVVSVFQETERIARVFKGGVIDYITKPHITADLQTRVLECWKRLLEKESGYLLGEGRIADLVPYAEKGLAHRFTTSFSALVRTVTINAGDIEKYMHDRFGLERKKDAQDDFFRSLIAQEQSISQAKKEWLELRSQLTGDDSSGNANVETLLKEIHQSLIPCLIVKNLTIDFSDEGSSEVLTFDNDVRAVLRELICGTATMLEDFQSTDHVIEIEVSNTGDQVQVKFTDHVEPISTNGAKLINEGASIAPEHRFGREWGLSVVQHVALRGGGRIQVEPQARGNTIRYLIPSAG